VQQQIRRLRMKPKQLPEEYDEEDMEYLAKVPARYSNVVRSEKQEKFSHHSNDDWWQ
jgi:hypothetical protein